jgi:hypothetical protein
MSRRGGKKCLTFTSRSSFANLHRRRRAIRVDPKQLLEKDGEDRREVSEESKSKRTSAPEARMPRAARNIAGVNMSYPPDPAIRPKINGVQPNRRRQ